ncbi:MAG: agmatinase [Patescibacteria group bacterium]|nr:agmatinase [Patescibacteria group bacterium]
MKFSIQKNGFLGIDQGVSFETSYLKARSIIVPFGMEAHVSYGAGTRNGPKAIIKASHQLNENDEQSFAKTYKSGLATLNFTAIPKDPAKALSLLTAMTRQISADGKFPVILGGEHTLTAGAVEGVSKLYQDLTVVHFDAHLDLRKQYRDSRYSHASALRRVMENKSIRKLVQIGIRSASEVDEEIGYLKAQKSRIKTFWAWETPAPKRVLDEIPTKDVYLTFDVDAFDPSIMPSTGTPEPGGLQWWQTLKILESIFRSKNVVGADVVELAPMKNFPGPDFMAAKLVYKLINYKFSRR